MKNNILENLENPQVLEKLYRGDKKRFRAAVLEIAESGNAAPMIEAWKARLTWRPASGKNNISGRLRLTAALAVFAGILAILPQIFHGIDPEFYYPRNAGFFFLPAISIFFLWSNRISPMRSIPVLAPLALGWLFINLLPGDETIDTFVLSAIHLPLFTWALMGLAYTGLDYRSPARRMDYLKFNGDLIVMTALILLSGGLLTGMTFALFSLLGMNIEEFYMNHFGLFGLAAAPVAATFIIQANSDIVGRIAPLIARIFSPLALIMLMVYLVFLVSSGQDLYNDRDFLIVFNLLLLAVMALTVFSISEGIDEGYGTVSLYVSFGLAAVTVILDLLALSAIIFRISEFGFTPNRTAVLGSNLLIFANLVLILSGFLTVIWRKADAGTVEKAVTRFLPAYTAWAALVAFGFPFIFGLE